MNSVPHMAGLPASAPVGATTIFVCDPEDFTTYAGDWSRLQERQGEPNFFQSYGWSAGMAVALSRVHKAHYRPLLAVRRHGPRVTAIWPLSLQRALGSWSLQNGDDPFGQFAGILAESQADADALVADTLEHVRAHRLANTARIKRVLMAGTLHRALLGCGAVAGERIGAPYVDAEDFKDFAALKSGRNKKTMKNLRNALNRMTKAGEIGRRTIRDPAEIDRIIRLTIAERERWLAATGQTSPTFRIKDHAEILCGLPAEAKQTCVAFELLLNGRSIAQQWGFMHGGAYYAYMSGTDEAFENLSPGRVHLAAVVEGALQAGARRIELMTPASPYKMTWTDNVHELVDMRLDLDAAGRLKTALWDEGARPLLKALYRRLPRTLRPHIGN